MKTWRFLPVAVPPIIFSMIFAAGVRGSVVINEVYYDHPGSDKGFEYVELYCLSETEISLEGWSIALIDGRTGALRELWRAGAGMAIDGGGLLLIGGDSCAVPPDCYLEGSIENGPDAVVLLSGALEIDLVEYGGEGPACSPGSSLSRYPDRIDAGDNGTDMVCSTPTPGDRNFHTTDLLICFRETPHVLCESENTEISVLLVNRGLDRYAGTAAVTLYFSQGGIRKAAGSRELSCAIRSGEDHEYSIPCAEILRGRSTLEVEIEAEGDTNGANDRVSAAISSSPGEVVINEIMYRPDRSGEWIELYNRTSEEIDLSGWEVKDRSGTSCSICDGEEIAAGDYIILAQDPGMFSAAFPACMADVVCLAGGWPRLNDDGGDGTADEIFIMRPDESLAESVSYRGLLSEEKGRSLERLSPELCSSGRSGIWLRCGASSGATPGEINYCHTGVIPIEGMSVSPDPFCPGTDGAVRFSAAVSAGEISWGASLYDLEGREVSRLASGPVDAPAVTFVWDGRDKEGRPAVTGLYVCVVEFKCGGGGVCRREKCVVRVWAGHR